MKNRTSNNRVGYVGNVGLDEISVIIQKKRNWQTNEMQKYIRMLSIDSKVSLYSDFVKAAEIGNISRKEIEFTNLLVEDVKSAINSDKILIAF